MNFLFLFLTINTQAQDPFFCELDIDLKAVGVCNSSPGYIMVTIKDGFGPYRVSWSSNNNSISEFLITDETSVKLADLPTGHFSIRVDDQYSYCHVIKHTMVEFDFLQGDITATGNLANCNGKESISIDISGNTPPYYIDVKGPKQSHNQINRNQVNIFNMISGDYEITIEKNGCKAVREVNVGSRPGFPDLDLLAFEDSCGINTGSIMANINDGRAPYSLSWTGPSRGTVSTDVGVEIGGLKTGSYEFKLTDRWNCKAYGVLNMNTIPLSISLRSAPERTTRKGFVRVYIEGGVPDYTINWTGPDTGSVKALDLWHSVSLSAGDYLIEVVDASGCSVSAEATVGFVPNATNNDDAASSARLNSTNGFGDILGEEALILQQNSPNPFDQVTVIPFKLTERMNVQITIRDYLGKVISSEQKWYDEGLHRYQFSRKNLPSGIYWYSFSAKDLGLSRRMVIR